MWDPRHNCWAKQAPLARHVPDGFAQGRTVSRWGRQNGAVTPAEATPATSPAPTRLDGRVLAGNLIGGLFMMIFLAFLSWPLALMGAVYVGVASVFFAAVYARPALSRIQEVMAWVAPWLVLAALWTWIAAATDAGTSSWLLVVGFGFMIATPCYLSWQAAALAVRQVLASRGRPMAGGSSVVRR